MSHDDVKTELSPRREDEAQAPAFMVSVAAGPDAGKNVLVDMHSPSATLVGKSAASQLPLVDPTVSRRHASLEVAGSALRVRDLGSTNGTRVNGVRVAEAFLVGGETLDVGSTTLVVERRAVAAQKLSAAVSFGRMVGASTPMRRLYPLLEKLAASSLPVLVEGETGTGKELLAEALHENGPRRLGPFVVLDCATVPASHAEAALFGQAGTDNAGVFGQAHDGTLLLDEVGELSPALQGKLLRAIERGEVARVGEDRVTKFDVRVIATSRRDIEKEVEQGRFREDLFYRLAVGRVELPPLRSRTGDVKLLAEFFWKRLGATDRPLPPELVRKLEGYGWPGNVRELSNAIARRYALGDSDLDDDLAGGHGGAPDDAFQWVIDRDLAYTTTRDLVQAEFERAYVTHVLGQHNGNVSRAAAASGLGRRYFQILRARQR